MLSSKSHTRKTHQIWLHQRLNMPIMTHSTDTAFLNIENAAHSGAFGNNPIQEPTEAQCKAGNYKMGRVSFQGLSIAIEQPRGTYRTGINSRTGKRWTSRMAAHYGYISGTKGADGDGVDCFVGPYPQSEIAYAINQYIDGRFDEHKIMLAFPDEETARNAYLHSHERGWKGLKSIVPMSISQFKWWLKNGDMSQPVRANNLPNEGLEAMTKRVQWDSEALPVGIVIDQLLYQIRQSEEPGNALLLDSIVIDDIFEESEERLALDALVTPFAKLNRKMELLRGIMERTGDTVKPVAMQITDPFKQLGRTNVAVIFELSDGQSVSIFFHNPDTTPNKITPADELISWKWLLNKKDITIVVAPERGADLNIREVSRRIMKLAEKNSAAFSRSNAKRSERMQNIQTLKDEIAGLEKELESAQRDYEVAKVEYEDKKNAGNKAKGDFAQGILKSLVDDFGWKNQGGGGSLFWVTKEIGGGVVSMLNRDGTRRLAARVNDGKIEATHGDNPLVSIELRTDESAKENASRLDDAVNAIDPNFASKLQESADFDPAVPENYAKILTDNELQLKYQDRLDALFQERLVAVRNALREVDWFGTEATLGKGSYVFSFDVASVGVGKNVVGLKYEVKDSKDVVIYSTQDDLTKTPEQIAAEIDAVVTVGNPGDEKDPARNWISIEGLKNLAENRNISVSDQIEVDPLDGEVRSAVLMYGSVSGTVTPDINGWIVDVHGGEYEIRRTVLSDALDEFVLKAKTIIDNPEKSEIEAESEDMKAAREFLKSVVEGDKDKDDLMALLDKIEASANAIIEAGKGEDYDLLIGQAAEKWAELDKQANG